MPDSTDKILLRLPVATALRIRAVAEQNQQSINRTLVLAVESFLGLGQQEVSPEHRSVIERLDQLTLAWQDAETRIKDLKTRLGRIEDLAESQRSY